MSFLQTFELCKEYLMHVAVAKEKRGGRGRQEQAIPSALWRIWDTSRLRPAQQGAIMAAASCKTPSNPGAWGCTHLPRSGRVEISTRTALHMCTTVHLLATALHPATSPGLNLSLPLPPSSLARNPTAACCRTIRLQDSAPATVFCKGWYATAFS